MSNSFNAEDEHQFLSWQKNHRRGKVATGMLVILFGTLFLLRGLGVALPHWIFSWEMILASIGLVVIIKHKFRTFAGYFLLLLAGVFLLRDWYPEMINFKVIWPVFFILLGFGIIFKSKFKRNKRCRKDHHRFRKEHQHRRADFFNDLADLENVSQDDFLDTVSFFGGVKKNVVSKQFRGADIVTVFGGNDLNLSQADFNDRVVMDVTNIFGGTTLTIPQNWVVKSEIVVMFGDVEDKRPSTHKGQEENKKVLILRGTCLFGGIEINSFQV